MTNGQTVSFGWRAGGAVPKYSKAFYIQICSLCPKKALYRFGKEGFCKDHRQIAVDKRKEVVIRFDMKAADYEARQKVQDDIDINHAAAMQHAKFRR